MMGDADLSVPARALGDPARARMVTALLGGRSVPASELAREAGVAASTASEHLRVLLDAGLVTVDQRGRNRFFRLASVEAARAVEALQAISPAAPVRSLRSHRISEELRAGRTCYDHLAGELGLRVTDLLVANGIIPMLEPGGVVMSPATVPGGDMAELLGVRMPQGSRPWARGCLDWSGRRPHVAGQVGADALLALERRGWVERRKGSRAARLTEAGLGGFERLEAAVDAGPA